MREETIGEIRVVVETIEGASQDDLRARWDALKAKPPVAAILVGLGEKVAVVAGATKDAASPAFKAAVESAAKAHGGRAGGRPEMIQGGLAERAAVEPFLEAALRALRDAAGAKA
jgi:alanyl-tRNA synthetase